MQRQSGWTLSAPDGRLKSLRYVWPMHGSHVCVAVLTLLHHVSYGIGDLYGSWSHSRHARDLHGRCCAPLCRGSTREPVGDLHLATHGNSALSVWPAPGSVAGWDLQVPYNTDGHLFWIPVATSVHRHGHPLALVLHYRHYFRILTVEQLFRILVSEMDGGMCTFIAVGRIGQKSPKKAGGVHSGCARLWGQKDGLGQENLWLLGY